LFFKKPKGKDFGIDRVGWARVMKTAASSNSLSVGRCPPFPRSSKAFGRYLKRSIKDHPRRHACLPANHKEHCQAAEASILNYFKAKFSGPTQGEVKWEKYTCCVVDQISLHLKPQHKAMLMAKQTQQA